MISKSRSLLLAATLLAVPMGAAMAQGGTGTTNSATSPSTSTTTNKYGSSAATNPNVPGATGRTVVPGSNSSMAGSGRVHPDPNKESTTAADGGK
jgi:hypothetical protein